MQSNNQTDAKVQLTIEYDKFLMEEYKTFKETKSRIFQLTVIGITGIPTSYFLVSSVKEKVLTASLPILIITFLLLFLAESRALMRCGKYIKNHIETIITQKNKEIVGWENWLEGKEAPKIDSVDVKNKQELVEHANGIKRLVSEMKGRRSVDKIVSALFYTIFIIYYACSVYVSAGVFGEFSKTQFSQFQSAEKYGFYGSIAVFGVIGFIFCIYLYITYRSSNTTE